MGNHLLLHHYHKSCFVRDIKWPYFWPMTPFSPTGSCFASWMHFQPTPKSRSFISKASRHVKLPMPKRGLPAGSSPTTPVARHCWVHRPCLSHDWSGRQDLDHWRRSATRRKCGFFSVGSMAKFMVFSCLRNSVFFFVLILELRMIQDFQGLNILNISLNY